LATAEEAATTAGIPVENPATGETIATVPLHMYQLINNGDGGKRPARNHPLDELLADQPNDIQSALEFREMMTAFALLRGAGIAEIRSGPRGAVDQLVPLHPDLVAAEWTVDNRRRYRYNDPRQGVRYFTPDELFIVRGRRVGDRGPLGPREFR
jgi:phage portal protein BeeE